MVILYKTKSINELELTSCCLYIYDLFIYDKKHFNNIIIHFPYLSFLNTEPARDPRLGLFYNTWRNDEGLEIKNSIQFSNTKEQQQQIHGKVEHKHI